MMMRTARILDRPAVEVPILSMAMTMTMARVNRRSRVARKPARKGREQWIGRRKGRRPSTGRGNGRGSGKWCGRGMETVKGKVLLNKPQAEMISLIPLRCSCRRKCMRQTQTQRDNCRGYIESWKHRPVSQFPQMMISTVPSSQLANMS